MKKQFLLSCILSFAGTILMNAQQIPAYQDSSLPIEQRIDDALSRMTLEEKVALCHAQGKFFSSGVPRLGIPGLWMSDGPHGVRAEMDWNKWDVAGWTTDSCTAFPSLTLLAATWNPELAVSYGHAIGQEAAYRGKNVLLGPGVNICRTPLNGRSFEYMGEDPVLSGTMAAGYIRGVQAEGVACCLKHYCLNNQEVGRWSIDVEVSERALRELYLPAFQRAVIEGKPWSLMGSYNKVRGTHASQNDYTLNRILKQEWGFDGAVVSDWDATHDMREAALGGLDIEMGTSQRPDKDIKYDAFTWDECYLGNDFLQALRRGEISEQVVNEKARRVLRLIYRTSYSPQRHVGNQDFAAHSAVARSIADEGIVLLKNGQRAQALLPLSAADTQGHILVVGDNATRKLTEGGGSSELKVHHETSVLAALQAEFGTDHVSYVQGYMPGRYDYSREHAVPQQLTDSLRHEAVEAARRADLVIFVGGLNKNKHQDCEDADRHDFDLPFGQPQLIDELAAANPRLVCILMAGNAVAMPWADKVAAILYAWYPGSETGTALADVLTGRVNPSGRLPISIAHRLEDVGAHSFGPLSYPGDGRRVVYQDDLLVGYRWHDAKHIAPRFPFGFGLSYTSFAYGKPTLKPADGQKQVVELSVTNTGNVAGREVVQLYIGRKGEDRNRPVRQLRHFAKTALLQPGQTATVRFVVDPATDCLRWQGEADGSFVCLPGTYVVSIGSSSADLRHHLTFRVK